MLGLRRFRPVGVAQRRGSALRWLGGAGACRRGLASSTGGGPSVRPAGEGALLLRFGTDIDLQVSERVLSCMAALDAATDKPDGVRETLPGYASLMVHFDPLAVSAAAVEQWCQGVAATASSDPAAETRVVEIPVRYGGEHGPDIQDVAKLTELGSAEEVARAHSEGDYRVYFLGFTGGFPYLGGLPSALTSVPRLDTPRQVVPKGAVGIAAGQTGVYTLSTPGGWYLLGNTPRTLFDPTQDPPALLRAGDEVKFIPVSEDEAEEPAAEAATAPPPEKPWVEIVAPGIMTTVQDVGRHGYARHGVSRSGAADDLALRMGNHLLGNDEGAAGLEVTLGGLKLRCQDPCAISLTGADCGAKIRRTGRSSPIQVRVNEVQQLQRDDVLELGYAKDGARAYVCVEGGVDVPEVLGSRSTDVRAGLGGHEGRTLDVGDSVGRRSLSGEGAGAPMKAVHDPLRSEEAVGGVKTWDLRILPGPGDPGTADSEVSAEDLASLTGNEFDVLPRSDRMAVCLALSDEEGVAEPDRPVGGQQMSEACVSGTIQLPPDNNPLILLAEHQTTGGYKVPAVVIQADLWQVGQMRPGDRLRFVPTTPEDATAALRERREQAREVTPREVDISPEDLNLFYLNALAEVRGSVRALAAERLASRIPKQPAVTDHQLPTPPIYSESSASGDAGMALRPRGTEERWIDLNADAGEGFDDAGLLEYVTSVNVSCGGHVGSSETIARTVALAAERSASIGAHVSFVDRENFGRTALDTPPLELRDQVLWQAGALDALCRGAGTHVRYIKPHGALYHTVMSGGEQGEAVREASELLGLPLLLMPRSPWASFGEGFAERAYDGDSLRSRDKPGALIHDPAEAAAQAVALAAQPTLHSICVHGDSPNAVEIAQVVRRALEADGLEVRPFL